MSYVPALVELVMLAVGSYWYSKVDNCQVQFTHRMFKVLVTLWTIVVFGVIIKVWHWVLNRREVDAQEKEEEEDADEAMFQTDELTREQLQKRYNTLSKQDRERRDDHL